MAPDGNIRSFARLLAGLGLDLRSGSSMTPRIGLGLSPAQRARLELNNAARNIRRPRRSKT